jgi:hypothetical protein
MAAQVIVYQGETGQAKGLEGKFLQLSWRGRPYLLFAPMNLYRYHNALLARFLEERWIAHRWAGPETLVIESDDVVVHGGGRFRLDASVGRLTLWDNSQAYGRFDAGTIGAQLTGSGHAWGGFDLDIE